MTRFHYGSSKDDNLMYLLGYYIGDPFFFLEKDDKQYVFLSILDIDAFRNGSNSHVEAVDLQSVPRGKGKRHEHPLVARALDILLAYSVQGTISVPSNFPLTLADELRKEGIAVSVAREWCPERRVKKSDEADAMRAVARTTVRAFAEVERLLREATIKGNMLYLGDEALTSESVRQAVEIMLLKENAICSEGLVLSCGVHAAMPHESGSGPLRAHETVVADIFPRSRDSYYFSDMTRTYVKGEPSPEVARMYKAVKESHDRSLEALKPGVSGKEVYEMSAEVIRSVGFDVGEKGYVHSLGHGVGVSVHEAPLLSPRSNDVLEVGNVVTVEPGLYYPEYGGIRIEDTVLITEDGYEILTKYETPWVIE